MRNLWTTGFLTACAVATASVALATGPAPDTQNRIVGANECAECHEAEVEVWKQTPHYAQASAMPRSAEARQIASALDIRRIKATELCTSCHYTVKTSDSGRPKAIHGVSCESCHGPAQEWIETHSRFGEVDGKDVSREAESAAHEAERLAACDAAGMNRPDTLYTLSATCFACHTTPPENVVNIGGHPVGADFELVAATQGDMRHNFARGPEGQNALSSRQRKRTMYLLGRGLELESALRSLAAASVEGPYLDDVRRRLCDVVEQLERVEAAASTAEVAGILNAARTIEPSSAGPEQREAALAAADAVRTHARSIARNGRGADLAGIDAELGDRTAGRQEPTQQDPTVQQPTAEDSASAAPTRARESAHALASASRQR